MTHNPSATIEKKTLEEFADILRAISDTLLPKSGLQGKMWTLELVEPIYTKLHQLLYKTQFLHPEDEKFVLSEGSDELIDRKIPASSAGKCSEGQLEVGIADARRIYLLVEDLANHLHRSEVLNTPESVTAFETDFKERILLEYQQLMAILGQSSKTANERQSPE